MRISKWNLQATIEEAKKYSSKKEWETKSRRSYTVACQMGWIKECSSHMIRPTNRNKKWNKINTLKEAKKYSSKKEWETKSKGSFLAAYRSGWLMECSSHMKSHREACEAEIQILDIVKKYYPNARTRRFENKTGKWTFKRLEIDVFIEDLKKGIEFDGEYWHSPEILAKNRSHWPKNELENYHSIKDEFFKEQSIEILHVSENTWKNDKDSCIEAILRFIEVLK